MAIKKGINSNTGRIYEVSTASIQSQEDIKKKNYSVTDLDYNPTTGELTLTQNPDNSNVLSVNIGKKVSEINFRGEWKDNEFYYPNDKVIYYGCMWIALKNNNNSPPRYNNPNWILAEGNPNLFITFDCPEGSTIVGNHIDINVTAILNGQNQNLTDILPFNNWSWERISKFPEDDLIWNESHVGYGNKLNITNVDAPGLDVGTTITYKCIAIINTYDNRNETIIETIQI